RNNRPWNIIRMPAGKHIRLHNAQTYGEDFDPDEHGEAIRAALSALREDPLWQVRYCLTQKQRAVRFWHGHEYEAARARLLERRRHVTDATREAHRQAMLRRYSDPAERQRQSELMRRAWARDDGRRQRQAELIRSLFQRADITEEVVRRALDDTGSIRGA